MSLAVTRASASTHEGVELHGSVIGPVGQPENTGAVVSLMVMDWLHMSFALVESVTVYVRLIVKLLGQLPGVLKSLALTEYGGWPPVMIPPWAVKLASSVAAVGTSEAHCPLKGSGQVIVT